MSSAEVVSEREQQESDVLKKAYTCGQEQQKNRLMHISKLCTPYLLCMGQKSAMVAYDMLSV